VLIDEVQRLLGGGFLDREQARSSFETLFSQEVPPVRCAAFLALLQQRGPSPEELAGFADCLSAHAVPFPADPSTAIDTCGTGGDGKGTFNLSTTAALVAAAAGALVLKHGNRAATSKSGSADLLEALGIPIDLSPDDAARQHLDRRFTFLFARKYHPILAKMAPIRSAIGFPTVFNLLGPLLNPARVRRQVIGVYDERAQRWMAEALRLRGCEFAIVLHGDQGLDEATPLGPFRALIVEESRPVREEARDPLDLGIPRCRLEDLQVSSAEESRAATIAVLHGEKGPRRDAVLINAALALEVAAVASSWAEGLDRARAAIDRGDAWTLVQRLATRGNPG